MENKQLFRNVYWNFYLSGTDLYVETTPVPEQLEYNNRTQTEKEEKRNEILVYFYNFWKYVESQNTDTRYTLHLYTDDIYCDSGPSYYLMVKDVLKSLQTIFKRNLEETIFKTNNMLARGVLRAVLTFYTPVRPLKILKST